MPPKIKKNKIKKRIYYLYDHQNKTYQRAAYTRNKKVDKLTIHPKKITLKEIEKILKVYLDPKTNLPSFIDTPQKKLFWNYASHELRLALTFSYHQRITKKSKKIPNTEIGDWQKTPFYKTHHKKLKTQIRLGNIARPLRILRSWLNLSGRHLVTLRFENIHLAIDLVNDQIIPTIHYDRHPPSCSPFSALKHLLFEDQKS